MKDLPQSFIIDYLHEIGVAPPNYLSSPSFVKLIENLGFELPCSNNYKKYIMSVNARYPERYMVPFAKAVSDDETVGFLINGKKTVSSILQIHDFADSGQEMPRQFDSFNSWASSI